CFAPRYHAAMRHAIPVRRELGVPTAFNFVGPLANPARVRRQVVGVGDPSMAATMVGVLTGNGATHVAVVHGADGLDELSTTGVSTLVTPEGEQTVHPADVGLRTARLEDLRGGDAATNAAAVHRVLAGEGGPHRDIVVLNAAAGLLVAGTAGDLAAGVTRAAEVIDSGAAARALDQLVRLSQEEAARERAALAPSGPVS
ncbi:MAG: anthranilate phosphoribosyltransferase, partial [Acidimicrobiales bacterium]